MNARFIFAVFLLAAHVVASAQTIQPEAPHPTTVEINPTLDMLHRAYVHWFVGSAGFGQSRMVPPPEMGAQMQAVADLLALSGTPTLSGSSAGKPIGFGSMALLSLPTPKPWPPKEVSIGGDEYRIASVQLISLLKHDPPVAYLPSQFHTAFMGKSVPKASRNDFPVRDLNEFEKSALTQLKQGANLVHVGNEKIVGAIRAQASCVSCHDADEGALLGAFSYVLLEEKKPQ